jgi:hypothetical protein
MDLAAIEALQIYPPLGIARVGNAEEPDAYLIGTEVIGGLPTLPSGAVARQVTDFRTDHGCIKRQAARFRVYAHLKDGAVKEVTADCARIEWRVAIANLKSGWYEFNQAMDLPGGLSQNALRRNRIPVPGGRRTLDIVPTPRSIEGRNAPAVSFCDGTFWHKPVYLGEMRTDSEGRLLFLGGRGKSAPFRDGLSPLTFANNVGWHDDVADGPVCATVTFPGARPMQAEAGYVVVTPPNFAPGLIGLVTLDDAVRETFQRKRWISPPESTSFTQDVWPLFDRLTGLQWVNHGLFVIHGYGSPLAARDTQVIDRLGDASPENAKWREAAFSLFRDLNAGTLHAAKVPQIYGDGYDPPGLPNNALAYLAVTPTQYAHLQRWAKGQFDEDWPGTMPEPPVFAGLPPEEQVTHLERAALHDCLGGPFHPGIELTWIMRLPRLWRRAYRLKVIDTDAPAKQDYGETLTPAVCTGKGGPFDGVAAGALTRFLGVPWQTDGASCNSATEYTPTTFLSMPTFWGARVPDQVLARENYERAAALGEASLVQAHKHFMTRVDWMRDVRGKDYYERMDNMVKEWWELGMVLPIPDPPPYLPADTRVEQGRPCEAAGDDKKIELVKAIETLAKDASEIEAHTGVFEALGTRPAAPPKRVFHRGEI